MWGLSREEFENRSFLELRRRIDGILSEAGRESELFFYIGCHGNALGLGDGGELPADRDLDEMLTLKELYEYVKENVARISEEKNLEWAATGASYLQTVQCYPPADGAFAEEVILE